MWGESGVYGEKRAHVCWHALGWEHLLGGVPVGGIMAEGLYGEGAFAPNERCSEHPHVCYGQNLNEIRQSSPAL